MSMKDRLQKALDDQNMNGSDLARFTKLSKGTIYNILNGTTKPEKIWGITAKRICSALNICQDWLLTGKGDMKPQVKQGEDDFEWVDVDSSSQSIGLGLGQELDDYPEVSTLKFRADSLARKCLIPHNLKVMYGSGDSMEPFIHNGDAIMYDTSDVHPSDGKLFVIMLNGVSSTEYNVKRCDIFDGKVYFKADNPHGDHYWIKPRRLDDPRFPIQIIGRVRWIAGWED